VSAATRATVFGLATAAWLGCASSTPDGGDASSNDAGHAVHAHDGSHEDGASAEDGDGASAEDGGGADDAGPVYDGPTLLSETGLYADFAARELGPDVLAYTVQFELWADGSTKRRFLWLPPGSRIDVSNPDAWIFPVGTRAWKEFLVDGTPVETRYLEKVDSERWQSVAYLWRSDASDADAVPEGAADARGTAHDVPDVAACIDCHQGSADHLLGIAAIQLETGASDALSRRLAESGRLDGVLPEIAIPGDELTRAALGYLHANCGHCHSARHPIARRRELRLTLPVGLSDPLRAPAVLTGAGATMSHVFEGTTIAIVPGDPRASQIWRRMQRRGDEWAMPPRGTEVADEIGAGVVGAWIARL
jgi:hypothetical protein